MIARVVLCIVAAALVTGGITYGGYLLWPMVEIELRGTFAADYKFIPINLAIFIALSLLEVVWGRIERLVSRKNTD
ncbi:MAG: hypothetical protein P8Q36_17930 [Alphaproteobacteria bacterium]|jgi:hypothetical protein|nr:hypothetical protein [Rhodospirillaceae bacterium]MDG2482722.1 hypothetical protein [Alphaproteobacteria bacterium]MBT6206285.1 hypothetical protein [Rhodospirillaceae bacterium]MBT6510099.1 hypothetical protein [Rhodospirillaceae bacterium]MBT7614749.1 hypothetical protein [Rhodospirillaceae bacterium]